MEDINKNQFVYKREVEVPPVVENKEEGIIGADGYTKTVYDSFNIESVLRSVTMDDGKLLVLLDDLHERNQDVPKVNRNGVPVTNSKGQLQFKTIRDTFQSEIYLSKEEGEKFLKLTSVNDYE